MGYSTEFEGRIAVEPPVGRGAVYAAATFSEERHEEPGAPGYWCNWRFNDDGSAIVWTGTEKTYDSEAWVQAIVDRWVRPAGSVASGEVYAQGEEPGDRWFLVVEANEVRREGAAVTPASRALTQDDVSAALRRAIDETNASDVSVQSVGQHLIRRFQMAMERTRRERAIMKS